MTSPNSNHPRPCDPGTLPNTLKTTSRMPVCGQFLLLSRPPHHQYHGVSNRLFLPCDFGKFMNNPCVTAYQHHVPHSTYEMNTSRAQSVTAGKPRCRQQTKQLVTLIHNQKEVRKAHVVLLGWCSPFVQSTASGLSVSHLG